MSLCQHGCVAWDLQAVVSYRSQGESGEGKGAGNKVGRVGQGRVGVRKLLRSRAEAEKQKTLIRCGVERADIYGQGEAEPWTKDGTAQWDGLKEKQQSGWKKQMWQKELRKRKRRGKC